MHFFEATFTKVEVNQFMKATKGFFPHRSNGIGPKVGCTIKGPLSIYGTYGILATCLWYNWYKKNICIFQYYLKANFIRYLQSSTAGVGIESKALSLRSKSTRLVSPLKSKFNFLMCTTLYCYCIVRNVRTLGNTISSPLEIL